MKKVIRIYRSVLAVIMLMAICTTGILISGLLDKNDDGSQKWNENSRNVNETLSNVDKVYPMGIQIGVYLETEGVLVASISDITGADGIKYSPADNKVAAGDYIVKMNGIDVNSKSQLLFLVDKYGNEDVVLTIRRNEEQFDVKITPVLTADKEYKLGIWVRDDTQGIGTMTFMTEDGYFGALGHGISDVDTKKLLSSNNGLLYNADIWSIRKGSKGIPGSLCGSISYEESMELGIISSNTDCGLFGRIYDDKAIELLEKYDVKEYEIAKKSEIKEGKASILCALTGEIKEYEIEISKVNDDNENNKGMIIRVTDEELLKLTNGIVQGMSGSPIIQNGRIVGAVTHVLVNDPTRGYGIFIENMLEH